MYEPERPVAVMELILLYVDDVRTSQETHLWDSTACYGDSFNFYSLILPLFLLILLLIVEERRLLGYYAAWLL
jgi:hypothetical protein